MKVSKKNLSTLGLINVEIYHRFNTSSNYTLVGELIK